MRWAGDSLPCEPPPGYPWLCPTFTVIVAERIHYGAAVRTSDLRQPTAEIEGDGTALRVTTLEGLMACDWEHGIVDGTNGSETLCGIPQAELAMLRHIWTPTRTSACPSCQRAAR